MAGLKALFVSGCYCNAIALDIKRSKEHDFTFYFCYKRYYDSHTETLPFFHFTGVLYIPCFFFNFIITTLQANMHELYVEYNLNPFSSIREKKKISSVRFDAGVSELVDTFNETYGNKGMSWM